MCMLVLIPVIHVHTWSLLTYSFMAAVTHLCTLKVLHGPLFSILHNLKQLSDLKGMRLLLWNIRSLLPKFPTVEASLDGIPLDILCFCETWLNISVHNNLITLPGYKLYRSDRKSGRRGGGLCVYVNDRIKCDSNKYSYLNVSNNDIETLVLNVEQPCSKIISIILCYRPPSGFVDKAISHMQNCLHAVPNKNEIILLGDLNFD